MVRILVVCLGNICRSPMASSVLQAMVQQRGWQDRVEVDSAGTSGSHEGERADRRAVALAKARGYPQIERERSRRITDADFHHFDLILAMDRHNLAQLRKRCPVELRHKLHLFLDYAGVAGTQEVPDPYFGAPEGFDVVLGLCERGSQGVLERLAAGG